MSGRAICFLMLAVLPFMATAQNTASKTKEKKIVPGIIVVKIAGGVSSNQRTAGDSSPLEFIKLNINTKAVDPVLPVSQRSRTSATLSGIERVYAIELSENENVPEAIKKLQNVEGIEYAEPLYENFPLYITNDPYANPNSGSQYYLKNIKAYEAWNVEKGDTNVVVGIVDTGVDINHADLAPNTYINHADPVNGIDDDLDGYIDNYAGWDIADNDNNPNTDTNGHGNTVTGVSSAKTNNGLGIAGVGFNSRFLPVKIMENTSGKLRNEYSGIIYAANHGAKVINLSWGSPWGYSKFAQDVINYAVLDRDIVVVAAAGNTNEHIDFYPASFDNVLSVTASDANDNLTDWATYSYKIDIMAPGQSIFSTKSGGGYGDGGIGTSFAAPMVAGAAALVRSKYPNLDARQVMEQLRVTADDVSSVGTNSQYKGKIGKGRLNIYKALTDTLLPAVRLKEFKYLSDFNQYIFPGDTVKIFPSFINYLKEAKNLKIKLSSADTNSLYTEKNYQISSIKTYESKEVGEDSWEIVLSENLPPNTRVHFRIDYEAEGYTDYEYFYIDTNPTYFDIENNDFSLTVSSDGDLGYDKDSFNWGNGVWLSLEKISNYMGVIISKNKNYVADNVVNNYAILTKDKDFTSVEYARMYNNSLADIDARSKFKEASHFDGLGIEVEQKILGWNNHPGNNFFVVEYRLINRSDSALDSLNIAFFADYDLKEKDKNAIGYDPATGLSYAYNRTGDQVFAGLSLITSGDSTVYAIDLLEKDGNIADLETKFPDTLKYQFSTSNMEKVTAGTSGEGNDVANLVGLKNIYLMAGESKKVAFVLLAGPSLENLNDQLTRAKLRYQEYVEKPPVNYLAFSCENGSVDLFPKKGPSFEIYADAKLVNKLDSGSAYHISSITKDTTYFVVEIKDGIREDVRTASVIMREPVADFLTITDTLLISGETLDTVRFYNQTKDANQFSWDFDNGYFSTVSNPVVQYKTPGHYSVQLTAKNKIGCTDTVSKPFFVAMRAPKPSVDDLLICRGEVAGISASDTDKIRVYGDASLTEPLYEGKEFISEALQKRTFFYVTNVDGYESLPVEVSVVVSNPEADFTYSVELDRENQLLKFESNSSFAENLQWQINSDLQSNEEVVFYDYSNNDHINISLLASDSVFCTDMKNLILVPSKSPNPVIGDLEICANGIASVVPEGGKNFLFYADEQGSKFLGSGSQFTFGPVQKDTILFVSNIDSLMESDLVSVNILVSSFKARVTLRPDTINLSETTAIEVTNTSIGADVSYFVWPSGAIDTAKNINQTITEPGTYTFTVVAKAGSQCIDTAKVNLFAYVITAADGVKEDDTADKVVMYPNPASDHLNIDLSAFNGFQAIEMIDNRGVVVFNKDISRHRSYNLEIDTSHLSNGIYLLRLHGKQNLEVLKVAINR